MVSEEIRVLVVDDSAVVRSIIADSIEATPGMKVVGTAGDGRQALEILDAVRPDVITLDIQMPNMDGLATLDAIWRGGPFPVVMVSSLTKLGANITLDALEHGAVDYLAKPDYGAKTRSALREDLPRKIRAAAGSTCNGFWKSAGSEAAASDVAKNGATRRKRRQEPAPARTGRQVHCDRDFDGRSAGLACLFESLRPPMPPIVVVQHMPPSFTDPLAWRLDSLGELSIREAPRGTCSNPITC